jgi:glycosyltransferase involved in cell wall biosynthesis
VNFNVVIYSPDRHIYYDLNTLNHLGVGGGITNRVRLAHGLNQIGCRVQLFVNCPKNKTIEGVDYAYFDQFDINQKSDIFIASTSGGMLNLSDLYVERINAKLKILLIHGITKPTITDLDSFDYYYVPSNFIRNWIINNWNVESKKIFTCHLGVNKYLYQNINPKKNKFRIMYCGHPDKGLQSAISVLELLRGLEKKYHLWVFGDSALWGEEVLRMQKHENVKYFGTIGQEALARNLQKCRYGLFLQEIPEAFGLSVIEAMSAGCIPIASPVGALNETITNGFNGLFIQGDHENSNTHQLAAAEISKLTVNQRYSDFLVENGMRSVMDWKSVAEIYTSHWIRILDQKSNQLNSRVSDECPICGGYIYSLIDGYHCEECGYLIRKYEDWKPSN